MKSHKINYVIVGSFVLLMLASLMVSVALLTGRTGATDSYYVIYDDVTNIKYGTRVMFEGYPVGQVEEIKPLQDGGRLRFRVDMSVVEGWKIPENSVAQITSSGLLSAVAINIHAGDSKAVLHPGDEISGKEQQNMFEVVSSVAGEITELIHRLRDIADHLSRRAPEITANLSEFSSKLNDSGSRLQAMLNEKNARNLEASLTNFSRLSASLRESNKKLDLLVEKFAQIASENRDNIKGSLDDLRHIMASISQHVDAISHNLEMTSRNMNEFSRQIRANPGALLRSKPPVDEAE